MVLVRTAWVCDDAYIAFRVVDNFVHGYGLRWNVAERVQTFTSPLWTLLMIPLYAATREAYYTSLALSFALSLLAAGILAFRVAASGRHAALALTVLVSSRAFIDYSTSGLENPLLHVLLAAFAAELLTREANLRGFLRLCSLAGLLALTRMDALPLVAPALVLRSLALSPGRALSRAALGFAPFLLWEAFSLVYYGFPFPNTAYAKLNTGIPASELVAQGLTYLLNSLAFDPLTLCAVAFGIAAPVVGPERKGLGLAAGIALALAYVVLVGGDFMSGRFLAAPLLAATALLARASLPRTDLGFGVVLLSAVGLGLAAPYPNLLSGYTYGQDRETFIDNKGITDERGVYFGSGNGLLRARRGQSMPAHPWRQQGEWARVGGEPVVVRDAAGLFGFYAGPDVHVLDVWALGDPLLARLPVKASWRVGHYVRDFPIGYEETVRKDRDRLEDPKLAAYHRKLRLVTRGDLFTLKRLRAIWDLNLGEARHLLDDEFALRARRVVPLSEAGVPRPEGHPLDETPFRLSDHGITIDLGGVRTARRIELSLDGNDEYVVRYRRGRLVLEEQRTPREKSAQGLRIHVLDVPPTAWMTGFDAIEVVPVSGDERFGLGHLRLLEDAAEAPAAPLR